MTIYDIAAEAGVSASTVSRVLNNKMGVNLETRAKVERLLRKYNFEPNASAQGLVSNSSKIVGIMMSDIRTSHHAEGAYFIEQQLQQSGYTCIIVNSGFSEASRENGFRILASRRAEAVVLIGSTFQTESVAKNIRKYLKNMPVIIENGTLDLPNVYSILADEQNGIAECLRLLYRKGRTHPCYINMNDTPSNHLKIQGFVSAWRERNPTEAMDPPVIHLHHNEGEEEWQTCYDQIKKLICRHPNIDSIIFSTDLLANAGVQAMMDAGGSVPDDIAVIGVDNSLYARLSRPQLTVLDNKMQELSIACSNILVHILNNEPAAHKMMILSEIIERDST